MDFLTKFSEFKTQAEQYLQEVVGGLSSPSQRLTDAVEYALSGGGKRLRPVLFLAVYHHICALKNKELSGCGLSGGAVKNLACAVEIMHLYSLVHDDLPCLDNDDFRRGLPSCHKKFDEATALLAGDALINLSYNLLFAAAVQSPKITAAAAEFSLLAGMQGLVGGQTEELSVEKSLMCGKKITIDNKLKDKFLQIYTGKTAALFVGSALLGGAAADADEKQMQLLKDYALNFGLAFQLKDDLCDMDNKSFARLFGVEAARNLIGDFSNKAAFAAKEMGSRFLLDFVNFDKHLKA